MVKIKKIILFAGDITFLYISLAVTLLIRYGRRDFQDSFFAHLQPFSLIFIIWILIFYLADLYDIRRLKGVRLIQTIAPAVGLSAGISIILFYLFSNFFELTPKTNLLILSVVFGIINFIWRSVFVSASSRINVLTLGDSPAIREIVSYLNANPQIGYDIVYWFKEDTRGKLNELEDIIIQQKIEMIIIPAHLIKENLPIVKFIYELLPLRIEAVNSIDFYEMIFEKAPIEELKEGWFIEKITTRRKAYDAVKRASDIILGIILAVIFLPVALIVVLLIKLTSPGPTLFKQMRVGKNGRIFTLYKFRSMQVNSQGPLWTVNGDPRLTPLGKILRFSHLDEIPQLYHIIKGDISFIGPRPERVELAEKYRELPYYDMRHIIKPGLTGWAQVNFRPSASLEEAFEKLKYDIYYVKNRSLILDLLIIIKTVKLFFTKTE